MHPMEQISTGLHFDWLWFAVVVSIYCKVALIRGEDYTVQVFMAFCQRLCWFSKSAIADSPMNFTSTEWLAR